MTDTNPTKKAKQGWAPIEASYAARNTTNKIRDLVDKIELKGNPDKEFIALSIGDPTVFGNLPRDPLVTKAVQDSLLSGKSDGYPHSCGYPQSREAIAKYMSEQGLAYQSQDIILTSGCSGAIEMAFDVLRYPGCNILVPRPGFSLYQTLADSKNMEMRSYNLLHDRNWEADVEHMRSLIDDKTVAIVINNPSNPCGALFSKEHLEAIVAVAEESKVPIIADEIYAHMVFEGSFTPIASVAASVPVLTLGGLAKRFLVPGWRVGWIAVHDPVDAFKDNIRGGLVKLSQHILGPNSIVQGAIPPILADTPQAFFDNVLAHIKSNATTICAMLGDVEGLEPVMPQGAMYLMVRIEIDAFADIEDDRDFCQKLITEQSVFCLPASVFGAPNFFRIVTTIPNAKMVTAMSRLAEFAKDHAKSPECSS